MVMAMEARAGPEDREKARRLVMKHKHLFKDMFAHFHPPGEFRGEAAGKSSNTQSSYCAVQRYLDKYGSRMLVRTTVERSSSGQATGEGDGSWVLELVEGPENSEVAVYSWSGFAASSEFCGVAVLFCNLLLCPVLLLLRDLSP